MNRKERSAFLPSHLNGIHLLRDVSPGQTTHSILLILNRRGWHCVHYDPLVSGFIIPTCVRLGPDLLGMIWCWRWRQDLEHFHKTINTSERHNIWWVFYLPVFDPTVLHCPPVFKDGSLCLQSTRYQHRACEDSLGSTSIIQPIYTMGTSREGKNRYGGMQPQVGIISPPPPPLSSVMGWTRWWEGTEHFGGSADLEARGRCLMWRGGVTAHQQHGVMQSDLCVLQWKAETELVVQEMQGGGGGGGVAHVHSTVSSCISRLADCFFHFVSLYLISSPELRRSRRPGNTRNTCRDTYSTAPSLVGAVSRFSCI